VSVIGIGVDAVEIARMRTALERTPTLLDRLFTDRERDGCRSLVGGLAARFAAKEAVAKAFGTGIRGFSFRDVEVLNNELGRPIVELHGGAASLAEDLGVTRVHLSMTTSVDLAIAHAVAES
jgi:holo-[acyl-carrier protein] synthase